MDKPPAPMFRDYGPSVEVGTTWVTGSPITAVLTLCPRDDHLYVENIAVDPSAQGCGLGRALMEFAEQEAARRKLNRMALVTHEAMTGHSDKWDSKDIHERFGYRYTDAELKEWAPKVRALARDTGQTHVLFNNCYRDNAPVNAHQLAALLQP
jgi:uncharacterized protein YecE (DUF72 family)